MGVRQSSLERRADVEVGAVHREPLLGAFERAGVPSASIPDGTLAKARDRVFPRVLGEGVHATSEKEGLIEPARMTRFDRLPTEPLEVAAR